MKWSEVLEHPSLQDLPFKIELNEWGQIVMSPASNKHSRFQMSIARVLEQQLGGEALVECSIDTMRGVKVADVVWMSTAFAVEHRDATPFPRAPEICVEVLSPSNTSAEMDEKITLYLSKGANEVWLCEDDGRMRFFSYEGEMDRSLLALDFPASI